MAPGTEFARIVCVWIGPMQLGVVLVLFLFLKEMFVQGHMVKKFID